MPQCFLVPSHPYASKLWYYQLLLPKRRRQCPPYLVEDLGLVCRQQFLFHQGLRLQRTSCLLQTFWGILAHRRHRLWPLRGREHVNSRTLLKGTVVLGKLRNRTSFKGHLPTSAFLWPLGLLSLRPCLSQKFITKTKAVHVDSQSSPPPVILVRGSSLSGSPLHTIPNTTPRSLGNKRSTLSSLFKAH